MDLILRLFPFNICLFKDIIHSIFGVFVFINFLLGVITEHVEILLDRFDCNVLSSDLFGRLANDVFDEELAITKLADASSRSPYTSLRINLCIWVDPRLLCASFAVAQSTVGAVDHLLLVFERVTAGRALLDALLIVIRPGAEEDGLVIIKGKFVLADVELSRLLEQLLDGVSTNSHRLSIPQEMLG